MDKKEVKFTDDGKKIEEIHHEDGTKSVKIHVNTLNLKETDEETMKAKEVIEQKILPKIGVRPVIVTVIHTPSRHQASAEISLPYFQSYVKACLQKHPEGHNTEDFIVVVHDGKQVQVMGIDMDL